MNLHIIDIGIIVLYLAATIFIGFYISKRASKDIKSIFFVGILFPGISLVFLMLQVCLT